VSDRPRRPIRRTRVAVLGAVAVLAMSLAACSSAQSTPAAEPAGPSPTPSVLVTIGGIETSNLDYRTDRRDTWTQIAFAQGMPAAAVLANLAGDDVTAESAVDTQLPELASLHPDVVTIWVESTDVRNGTPAADYRAELTQLVAGARRAGAHRVLLLTPPLDQQNLAGGLADSVAAVAASTGATLVRLDDTSDRYSVAGQRQIARSVVAAMK
jgi:hypothetical protein